MADRKGAMEARRLIKALYDSKERPLERILVRSVSDDLYAVQTTYRGEREPEAFFVELSKLRQQG